MKYNVKGFYDLFITNVEETISMNINSVNWIYYNIEISTVIISAVFKNVFKFKFNQINLFP